MGRDLPVRRILHCDMDCFYAAVHARDEPALRGRPLVIGGDPEGRGVVAAASYEARRYGIRSAMPSVRARRLCPDAVFLRPDFSRYRREAQRIFGIYRDLTPLVQTVALDEAYLDVTDRLEPFGTATAVAREVRSRVRRELGLTVSVGVGPSKLVAKIASDFRKPDGLTVVSPRRVLDFLAPLPVRRLPGVGPATEKRLRRLGVATVADLRRLSAEELQRRLGRYGGVLHDYAHGIDERPVEPVRERKSLGHERTYRQDLTSLTEMKAEIERLAVAVAAGLERHGLCGCTVSLKVRFSDFQTVTRSRTLSFPTRDPELVSTLAQRLLACVGAEERPVRLLGVTVSGLVHGDIAQLSLFGQ